DFMAIRYYWFAATVVLTVAGITLFIGRLPDDLNIDFVGGTAYSGQLVKPVRLDSSREEGQRQLGLRELLGEDRQKELLQAEVKEVPGSDGRQFEVRYREPDGGFTPWRTVSL